MGSSQRGSIFTRSSRLRSWNCRLLGRNTDGYIPMTEQKDQKVINKNIKVDEVFPAEVSNSIQTVTTYLPYKDTLKFLPFCTRFAPLVRLGTKIICNPYSDFAIPLYGLCNW